MANYLIHRSGISSAGAYQVSGVPFISGSGQAIAANSGTPHRVSFPYVTKWITVENTGGEDLRVAFSSLGAKGTAEPGGTAEVNYFVVRASGSAQNSRLTMDVRVKDIYLLSNHGSNTTSAQIVAGLTFGSTEELTGTADNWYGSSGVG